MQTLSLCLLVLVAATLHQANCHLQAQAPPGNCPPMWSGNGEYCFQFFKARETWQTASEFCSRFASCATGVGATLVKLRSAADETRLESFLAPKGEPNSPNVWLGLGDPLGTGVVSWPDGTTPQSVGYRNFGQGGRNGNCVLKDSRTGAWAYAQCTQRNSFVCQMERVAQQPARGTPTRPV